MYWQVCVSLEPAGEAEKSKVDNASQGTINASNNESGTPLPQHPKGQNPAQSMEAEESSGRPCTSAEQDTVGSACVEDGLSTAPPDPAASDSAPGGDSSPRKRTRAVREKQQQAAATADSDAGEATPNRSAAVGFLQLEYMHLSVYQTRPAAFCVRCYA